MKKQNLNKLLGASAVFTGVVTYIVVKLTAMPLLQFMPFMLFALVLLLFFSKHIKKHYQRWNDLFSTLVTTWVIAIGIMFSLFYVFPVEGMMPRAWTSTETTMLISVNAAFALAAGLTLASIMYATMGGARKEEVEKIKV